MALLASKRYLSKAEIYQSIPGYEGSAETKERMFERDKNDLRLLGLEIEVGSDDPLFDDELGYRINPKNYGLDIDRFDEEDLLLLSVAANQWQSSFLSSNARSALLKLESLLGVIDRDSLPVFLQKESPESLLGDIWQAVDQKLVIEFDYRSTTSSRRRVAPYGLYLSHGFWYLVAEDSEKKELRRFKVARIDSKNFVLGEKFQPRTDFNLTDFLSSKDLSALEKNVSIRVRKGRAQEIRALADMQEFDDDWDLAGISEISRTELFELLARTGPSARLNSHEDLALMFTSWIKEKRHG